MSVTWEKGLVEKLITCEHPEGLIHSQCYYSVSQIANVKVKMLVDKSIILPQKMNT